MSRMEVGAVIALACVAAVLVALVGGLWAGGSVRPVLPLDLRDQRAGGVSAQDGDAEGRDPSRPRAPQAVSEPQLSSGNFTLEILRPAEGHVHHGLVVEYAVRVVSPWGASENRVTIDGILALYDRASQVHRVRRSFPWAGPVRSVVSCVHVGPDESSLWATRQYVLRHSTEQDAEHQALETVLAGLGPEVREQDLFPTLASHDLRLGRSLAGLLPRCTTARAKRWIVTWLHEHMVVDSVPDLIRLLDDDDWLVRTVARGALRGIIGEGMTGKLLARYERTVLPPDVGELLSSFGAEEDLIRERLSQRKSE